MTNYLDELGTRRSAAARAAVLASTLVGVATLAVPSVQADPWTIDNVATLTYEAGGQAAEVTSNDVVVEVQVQRTPAVVEFLHYAPHRADGEWVWVTRSDFLSGTGQFVQMPPLAGGAGTSPDLTQPIPLVEATLYHRRQPIFLRLTDFDQNLNPFEAESVVVDLDVPETADRATVRLWETGPGTGVFTGYITSVAPADEAGAGTLAVVLGATVLVEYIDVADPTDADQNLARVDPFSRVFDSVTGAPIDGATITLLDDASGTPATVHDDDFRSQVPASLVSGTAVAGVGDPPAGGFRFPTVATGAYRYAITPPPGYQVLAVVDVDGLNQLPGAPFLLDEAASRGEPFAVNPGPSFAFDVPLAPIGAGLSLAKTVRQRQVGIGDVARFSVRVTHRGAPLTDPATLTDRLPVGLRLLAETVRVDGAPAVVLVDADGRAFQVTLPVLSGPQPVEVTYGAQVTGDATPGTATNRAIVASGPLASNVASATVHVEDDFRRDQSTIVGRVFESDCGAGTPGAGIAGVRVYLEDGTVSVTDERGRYHFAAAAPGGHVVQLDSVSLPPGVTPLLCDDNSRFAGRAWSRFVDLRAGGVWRADFRVEPAAPAAGQVEILLASRLDSATAHTTARGAVARRHLQDASLVVLLPEGGTVDAGAAPAAEAHRSEPLPAPAMPAFDAVWLEAQPDTNCWLWPEADHAPAIPRTKVVVQHAAGARPALRLNGQPVEAVFYDGASRSTDGRRAISRWSAVPLTDGDNRFVAVLRDSLGGLVRLDGSAYYAGQPVRVELVPEHSKLVADGRRVPVVALRFYDHRGRPARPGLIGTMEVMPPFRPLARGDRLAANALDPQVDGDVRYTIGHGGIALVDLEPTTESGQLTLRVPFEQRSQDVRAWLEPEGRDWVLVGFAEGTAGYQTVAGHQEALSHRALEEDLYEDGRVAFFARGRIRGSTLLTVAFDSARPAGNDPERLFREVDPDQIFTLYGDATGTGYDAPTAGKLYVKVERRQFLALFGDFDTGFEVTELARYARRLNGFNSRWTHSGVSLAAFASETASDFVRVELRPDGTSGRYFLGRTDLVENSEVLTLETRDRHRSERVLRSDTLVRNVDYSIDPLGGTVRFRQPIPTRDAGFNPITIVAEFETLDQESRGLRTGGRGQLALSGVTVGATALSEDYDQGADDLVGLDARLALGQGAALRGEVARSHRRGLGRADAYLAELTLQASRADALLYAREQGAEFGLGHQPGSERGLRKFGAEVAYEHDRHWGVDASAHRHRNLVTAAEQDAIEARLTARTNGALVRTGYRHLVDRPAVGRDTEAGQFLVGGELGPVGDRLRLRADHEHNLDDRAAADYPNRTWVAAGWTVVPPVVVTAEHEWVASDSVKVDATWLGVEATAWRGGAARARLRHRHGEFGPRVYANLGLRQDVPLGDHWSIDLALERGRTLLAAGPGAVTPVDEPTFGADEDYVAVSAGAARRGEHWSWTQRLEHRRGDAETKWGVTSGIYGEVRVGLSTATSVHMHRVGPTNQPAQTQGKVRMSWAARPVPARWIMVSRLEGELDRQVGVSSWKAVENLHVNWLASPRTQLESHWGLRWSEAQALGRWTALLGIGARHDLSPRFDLGVRATTHRQSGSGATRYQWGGSVGSRFVDNTWLELGYNVQGFDDPDFRAAGYSARGPYVTFRVKVDQASLRELLR